MSFIDKIKERIKRRDANLAVAAEALYATSDKLTATTSNHVEEEKEADPKTYQIPISVGEYFPWKGHVFRISEVSRMTFTAECKGVTKNRSIKMAVR